MTKNWYLDPSDMVKRMTFLDGMVDLQTRLAGREVGEKLKTKTTPSVPLRKGWLERSYRSVIRSEKPLQLDISYSAKGKNGYDYAAIQHEAKNFKHPQRGIHHYLQRNFETNYPIRVWKSHLLRVL
jgi:hypothetical protein